MSVFAMMIEGEDHLHKESFTKFSPSKLKGLT